MPTLCKRIPVEFGNELADALFHFAAVTSGRADQDVIARAAMPTIHRVRRDVESAQGFAKMIRDDTLAIVSFNGDDHTFPIILAALLAWADNAEVTGTEEEWHAALAAVSAWIGSELETL